MNRFTINFENFSIFVHHTRGLTVLFGGFRHRLKVKIGFGAFTDVPIGADIRLVSVKDGVEVVGGGTRPPSGVYMPELRWMMGGDVVLDPDRVLGSNRTGQNARLHLHGGHLDDRPSWVRNHGEILSDVPWDFGDLGATPEKLHLITNRARFTYEMEDDCSYELHGSAGRPIALISGLEVSFCNEDTVPCEDLKKLTGEVPDRELPQLLLAAGIDTRGKTAKLPDAGVVERLLPGLSGSICQPCQSNFTQQTF